MLTLARMFELRASARLVVWGNALLGGGVSPDEATDRIVGNDPPHRVAGLPAEPAPVGVALALGRLRTGGVTALRLVLPVPGDPGALPGPPAVNAVALEAGEAVLTVDGVSLALVPAGRAAWQAYDVAATRLSLPSLAEAERMLTEELRDCADELLRLDVARWAPEAAAFLAERATSSVPPLPAVYPPRATAVLAQGLRLGALAALASRTEGAAVSASEIGQRAVVLGRLAAASRRAVEAACNARL